MLNFKMKKIRWAKGTYNLKVFKIQVCHKNYSLLLSIQIVVNSVITIKGDSVGDSPPYKIK